MLLAVKGNTLDSAQVVCRSLHRSSARSWPARPLCVCLRGATTTYPCALPQIRMAMTHCQTPAHMLLLVSMSRS